MFENLLSNIQILEENEINLETTKTDDSFFDKHKQEVFEKSGVNPKYLNKRLTDFNADTDELKTNIDLVKKYITDVNNRKSRTMWMCGKPGTGKTFLGSMITRECEGYFCKSYEIANELEDCKSFKARESKTELIKRYGKYKLLVIDEIAKFESKQEIEYLFMILNERYENLNSTVLITNLDPKGLKEYLGEPLFDRFVENCTSLKFNGESYRSKEREN